MVKFSFTLWLFFNLFFIQCSGGSNQQNNAKADTQLKLVATIPLPNVSGRIDHLAYNGNGQFLYIAALGNNTVEIIDLKARKVAHTIRNLGEPQGIQYLPENDVIFVANGENGMCNVFSAKTFKEINSLKLNGDADNVRYDALSKKVYVGYGSGSIAIVDARTFKKLGDVNLPGHPESFQLDQNTKKIFVNIPGARLVDVIDLNRKRL